MKKVLLGVLALSVVSFGETSTPKVGDTASVPVTVKAVIEKVPAGLAIVDEVTGQMDQVVIDHGTIGKGTLSASSPSIQTKGFRVVRMDADGKLVPLGATELSVGLSDASTTLTKIGSSDTNDKLTSNLEVYHKTGTLTTKGTNPNGTGAEGSHYTVALLNTDDEHRGEIRSIITTTGFATDGRYDNMTSRPTLAVRIDAISTPPQP